MTAIRALVADRVRMPFRRPFPTATGMWLERDTWLIRLLDSDGRIGLGEAVLEPAAAEVAETILAALIREAAESANDGRLPSMGDLELHGAPGRALNAAIESALLDLAGPVGEPDRAPDGDGVGVNATIPSVGSIAAAEAALQSVESGFMTLKIKAGAERETDVLVERIRAIRTAVGPDVSLRLDVNGAWDLTTAEDRLEAIAHFDIEYVEQPLPAHDIDDWPSCADGSRSRSRPTRRPSPCARSGPCSRPRRWTCSSSNPPGSVGRPRSPRSPSGPPSGVCRSSSARCSRPASGSPRRSSWRPAFLTSSRRVGPAHPTTGLRRRVCLTTTCCASR